MNKQQLCIALLMLLGGLQAKAQQPELCICQGDSCDVFEARHVGRVNFADGYVLVDHWLYDVQRVDSIVFARPGLSATELGWWGDLDEGASRYEVRFYDTKLQFAYHLTYRITAHEGLCQSASCTVTFSSDEQKERFESYFTDITSGSGNSDPYIYVKETLTGPRKFELWTMSGPCLPSNVTGIEEHDKQLGVDLTYLLAGRPMTDVLLIIEGWIYNPLIPMDNPVSNQ